MSGRPREAIVLFLDENLDSEVIVAALRAAGRPIERHRDHFLRGAADEEWLPVVAANGWVILTRDARIRRVPSEREAMQRAKARLVIYRGHDDAATMAAVVLEAWTRIENCMHRYAAPVIANLYPNARLEVKAGVRQGGKRK